MKVLDQTKPHDQGLRTLPDLRHLVLASFYQPNSIVAIDGYQLLCARYLPTNVGVFVVAGDFGRTQFKLALQEARAAGLDDTRIYAYGRTGSYSGRSICFTKLDELTDQP